MSKLSGKIKYIYIGTVADILIYIVLICLTNIFHFNYRMNSDLASDVILGELIWKRKEIIPGTWYVANETRIICTPNIASLFFGITQNMTLATSLACCIMSIMIILSILLFGRSVGMKNQNTMLMILLCIVIPCSLPILELLYLFACYYAIHVVFMFVTLAIYVITMRSGEVGWLKFLVGIIMAFLLGLQGVRGVLVIYGPMFGIELIRNMYFSYQHQKRARSDFILTVWVVLLLMFSYIGICTPFSVGQGFSRNIRNGFNKLFTIVMPDVGRAIGWESANGIGKACLGILILISLYALITLLWRMVKKEFITPIEWGWLVICSSPVVSALMVAFTTVESTQRYYFMLPFWMAFSVILLLERKRNDRTGIALLFAVILSITNIFQVYLPILSAKEPPNSSQYEVVRFLEEENYTVAYATFEHANMMTVLSNGKVRVYPVASVENMNICKWMTSTEWYWPNLPYDQKTAYIITDAEMDGFYSLMAQKDVLVQKEAVIGEYTVYISDYNYSNLG